MPRLPRLFLPGCAQHVIQRGNNREACFYSEADYKTYLAFLKDVATKYEVAIHAFVLMTNHIHLLVTPFSFLLDIVVQPTVVKFIGAFRVWETGTRNFYFAFFR